MGLYRAQIVIVTDILDVVQEDTFDKDGASVTSLIRKANISHGRLSKILKNLVSQGLLEQVNSDRASKYKISMTGREFLHAYRTFSEFTNGFGLTI
jgi:predicted transcriptional regulator